MYKYSGVTIYGDTHKQTSLFCAVSFVSILSAGIHISAQVWMKEMGRGNTCVRVLLVSPLGTTEL